MHILHFDPNNPGNKPLSLSTHRTSSFHIFCIPAHTDMKDEIHVQMCRFRQRLVILVKISKIIFFSRKYGYDFLNIDKILDFSSVKIPCSFQFKTQNRPPTPFNWFGHASPFLQHTDPLIQQPPLLLLCETNSSFIVD